MKKIFLLLVASVALLSSSCRDMDEKLEAVCHGAPEIRNVKALVSDTANVTELEFGSWVLLEGYNFCDVQEILVNDVSVNLYGAHIEKQLISFRMPRQLPEEDTETVTVITPKGKAVKKLKIIYPPLELKGLACEFAQPGDTIFLKGKNFDLYKFDSISTHVRMRDSITKVYPAGAETAFFRVPRFEEADGIDNIDMQLVKIDTISGNTLINRKIPGSFRPTANVMLWHDDFSESWRRMNVSDGSGSLKHPKPISGKYAVIEGDIFAGAWRPDIEYQVGFPLDVSMKNWRDLLGPTDNLVFKIEINVVNSWNTDSFYIMLLGEYEYFYKPWASGKAFQTNGWMTLTIPLTDFKSKLNQAPFAEFPQNKVQSWSYPRFIQMADTEAGPLYDALICWDNPRIVIND